ncbi:MAG: type III-B CRISPR module-associated protein Cmr5 [Oxalobacteraceae bacterium]|nr:type III-B CRISPR module-associated protein Cmr5 [Oxalobacteraceae bacterium]
MQTLQQQRAKHALEKVRGLEALRDGDKFKSRASELPFMIHVNGLGQAAAFFRSKSKDGYPELSLVLSSWLCRPEQISQPGRTHPFAGKQDLMQAITECSLHDYRVAQAEAMQYMDWVKKFANAYL